MIVLKVVLVFSTDGLTTINKGTFFYFDLL